MVAQSARSLLQPAPAASPLTAVVPTGDANAAAQDSRQWSRPCRVDTEEAYRSVRSYSDLEHTSPTVRSCDTEDGELTPTFDRATKGTRFDDLEEAALNFDRGSWGLRSATSGAAATWRALASSGCPSPRSPARTRSRFLTETSQQALSGNNSDNDVELVSVNGDAGEAQPSPLGTLIEGLEKALGRAFRMHRERIEEILGLNMDNMHKFEQAFELSLEQVKAENAMLRQKLGMRPSSGIDVTNIVPPQKRESKSEQIKRLSSEDIESPRLSRTSGARPGKFSGRTKGEPENQVAAAGGMWQHLVAWVPAGTVLHQNGSKWQALPDGAGSMPNNWSVTRQSTQSANGFARASSQSSGFVGTTGPGTPLAGAGGTGFFGTIPGQVNVQATKSETPKRKTDELDDDDDEFNFNSPFEVVECFVPNKRELRKMQNSREKRTSIEEHSDEMSEKSSEQGKSETFVPTSEQDMIFQKQKHDSFIIHPHSNVRITWDVFSLFLVTYDMIYIPMQLFQPEDASFLTIMTWTTRLFWTLDVIASCTTGVVLGDGTTRLDFKYVVRHYLKTWFVLDVIIVGSDWMEFVADGVKDIGMLGRLGKAARLVRVIRLLRLARMKSILKAAEALIQSGRNVFIINSILMLLGVLLFSHVFGSIWWGIGVGASDRVSWAHRADLIDTSMETKYLVSAHWALSQFTGGMDELPAVNATERLFTVVAWILGFMGSAVIVSTMTSSLTQAHIIGGGQERQLATLRTYLHQNYISIDLALRMQRNAQHALGAELTEDVVELMPVVSENLRVEMHFEVYSRELSQHAFLNQYILDAPFVMRKVCHYGIQTALLCDGELVFTRGETPPEPAVYFVNRGTLDYSIDGLEAPFLVGEHDWVTEAALWVDSWTHRGTLKATGEVKLFLLDATSFQNIVARDRGVATIYLKVHATEFVEKLNGSLADVTDLGIIDHSPKSRSG